LGVLPIIASVSLTHLPSLFVCLHESLSCVYAVLSTYLSTCVALAACFVLGSVFLTAFFISFFFVYKSDRHLCYSAFWCTHNPTNMPKQKTKNKKQKWIYVYFFFSTFILISLIPAYVYLNVYTHFPPLPYSYTFIAIFISMFCVLFSTYNHLFVFFLIFLQI